MNENQIKEEFRQGQDCSQVVLAALTDNTLDPEIARRLSAAFGGGFMQGETCGAITGALMAIGLQYGHSEPGDFSQKEILSEKRAAFLERFHEKYPSTQCRSLIGYDFSKTEDIQKIMDSGILFDFCPKLVAEVIEIAKEI